MLEELAMDKKSSIRLGQAQSKGNCSESKKLQDATNGKPFPRNARKREPPNSNGSKPEQNRKPMPQKTGKFPDNRPKPRGGLAFNRGRNENSQMTYEDFEPEFDDYLVVYESGSKKQSLSHLCNFHYEPRGENVPKRSQHTTHGSSTKSLMATQAHKYNKEQFLQANCQFVVREEGDYTFNLGDPDLLVDWDHVELIITSTTDKVICPICLYPPVAGKITRCGHVFCWSCVLHYLALSDKSWRKCPICYESIHKKDLKSVECVEKDLYSVGQKITMRLMKREKGTLVATPVNQFTARSKKPILSYSEKDIDTSFSKLLTASQNDVMNIISREYSELQTQVEEFKGCPEICFVEQALELLTERKSLVEAKNTEGTSTAGAIDVITSKEDVSMETSKYTELASSPEDSPKELIGEEQDSNRQSKRSESESAGSEGDEFNISAEDLEIKTTNQAQKHYYFYQAADGQHIYLHSINVRMLEMTHGSLENCPHEITGKIVEKESGSMTTPLRKRLRYLQHVPITCQFEVIELDIRPPVISEETLAAFEEQIEDRRRRRQRQARAEKRREKKIEEAELRRFNRRPAPNLRIESHFHFPEFGLEEQQRPTGVVLPPETSRSGQSSRSSSPKRDRSPFSSAVAALSLDNEDSSSGPSFAQLLREGKTVSSEAWPTLGGGSSSSTAKASSSSGGPVWGRRTRQVSVTHESADSDNDTAFSPPAKPSFNIAEAIQLAASIEKGENTGGRKKKKKQQKILFSTGVPKGN